MGLQLTQVNVAVTSTQTKATTLAGATASLPLNYLQSLGLGSGTGSGQADTLWVSNRTLLASAAEDIDLAGSLTDAFGATVNLARVKGLLIAANAANTNNVVVGNAASNGFISWVGAATHTVSVRPGGLLLLTAPDAAAYAVTAGTADLLHIANSGAGSAVTYDIVVIGSSA